MTEQSNAGGRPTIGPKNEVRLYPTTRAEVDDLAAASGTTRAETLRILVERGLSAGPDLLSELVATPDVDEVAWEISDDASGVYVVSDGRQFWIAIAETGEVIARTDNSRLAAAMYGAALVSYGNITTDDTLQDGGSDTAYPELVDAGRAILDGLAEHADQLNEAAAKLR